MTEWPLVGRNDEQALVRRLAADRRCHGVVLVAPAGSGKTRLATECLLALAHMGMLVRMYRSGHLKLTEMITRTYPLSEINEAYDDMHAGRNIRGVIVYD